MRARAFLTYKRARIQGWQNTNWYHRLCDTIVTKILYICITRTVLEEHRGQYFSNDAVSILVLFRHKGCEVENKQAHATVVNGETKDTVTDQRAITTIVPVNKTAAGRRVLGW